MYEVIGDAQNYLGRYSEARTNYMLALQNSTNQASRALINMKISDLEVEKLNSFQKTLVLISIFVLSSCSSLGWLKFWGDDDEEEGPAELYKILENRVLDRQWSSSNSNDLVSGRLIPLCMMAIFTI